MSDYRYLKEDSYYNDLYDLHTIETCLDYYWGLKDGFERHRGDKDFKKFTKKQFDEDIHKVASYTVNAIKIERFRHKKDTVQKWMDDDRQRQDRLDSAIEPKGIFCLQCSSSMNFTTKSLEDYMNKPMRVLFFFKCPNKCKRRRGVYDDGTDFVSKPQLCPKCHKEVKVSIKRQKNVLIWTTTCLSCGYKDVDKNNSDKWEAEREKREERDRLLLEKYRNDFCYSEEVGQKAVMQADQLKVFVDQMKEKEEHKEEYDAVAKIKKITVVELEKLLNNTINPQGYIRLELSKPEFGKQLIVGFTVQDSNTARQEYDSRNDFRKLVHGVLVGTNWRLISEGITYRLGYLQGRLKAYETEEDLLDLVKKSNAKK
ncbi:ZPR1-type zinc finger protein [Patescibacteria group bacterium]|nr:ZPR1-type zinc finger protein [Patescibacteria group bacterium]